MQGNIDLLIEGRNVINTNPAHAPNMHPVTGQYTRLERLEEEHYQNLYESLNAHPSLWVWWPDGPFDTLENFSDYMDRLKSSSSDLAIYAVIPVSGPLKGRSEGLAFALSEDRLTNRVAELGLFYGPGLQRTRAATEVVYLLADLLFQLNHRRLQWKTNALNVQSRMAASRFGFVYEGTFRQHQINKGRNRDSAWYSIIDSEWPVCKLAFELWLNESNFDEEHGQRQKLEHIRSQLSPVET